MRDRGTRDGNERQRHGIAPEIERERGIKSHVLMNACIYSGPTWIRAYTPDLTLPQPPTAH